jgi:hypothetical protein
MLPLALAISIYGLYVLGIKSSSIKAATVGLF